MSNPYLTGSFNKYRNKIRGNMKTNNSISPNIKWVITDWSLPFRPQKPKGGNRHCCGGEIPQPGLCGWGDLPDPEILQKGGSSAPALCLGGCRESSVDLHVQKSWLWWMCHTQGMALWWTELQRCCPLEFFSKKSGFYL